MGLQWVQGNHVILSIDIPRSDLIDEGIGEHICMAKGADFDAGVDFQGEPVHGAHVVAGSCTIETGLYCN